MQYLIGPQNNSSEVKAKQLLVKHVNGEDEPKMTEIYPGLTVRELKQTLGFGPDFVLSKGDVQLCFKDDDILYPLVSDGDVLYVSASIKVGHS